MKQMNDENIDYCHHDSKTLNTNYYEVLNGSRSCGKTLTVINTYEQKYNQLQSNWNSLREINNEAREYLTSYEAISTIQGLDNIEKNKQLDEKTINEMTNRYLKVHDKLLSILDKMNELEGKDNNE